MNLSRSEKKAWRSLYGQWLHVADIDVCWYSSRQSVLDSLIAKGLVKSKKVGSLDFPAYNNVSIVAGGGSKISDISIGSWPDPRVTLYKAKEPEPKQHDRCPYCNKKVETVEGLARQVEDILSYEF